MKTLTVAILATALSAVSAAHGPWAEYWSQKELISYQLPSAWQVQDEHSLEESGYLSAPYPPYTLIAGAEPATLAGVSNPPSGYALSETPSPWFMVVVETGPQPRLQRTRPTSWPPRGK